MHWIPLFYTVWFGVPIVLLLLFGIFRPKLAPLTLLVCPVVDILAYWQDFLSYEGRPFILFFIALQISLTGIPAFILRARAKGKEDRS